MTFTRILELWGGVLTALLGIAVNVALFLTERATALQLHDEFRGTQTFLLGAAFFILPSMLVGVGAYLHAVKRWSGGWASLIMGAITVVILFLLFFSVGAFGYRTDLWSRLYMLLVLSTVVTLVLSFLSQIEE
jgi:hypothetical protein